MAEGVNLVGQRIVAVRAMTEFEAKAEGWGGTRRRSAALVLEDGTVLYPSRDSEGNGPGELFGIGKGGCFVLNTGAL